MFHVKQMTVNRKRTVKQMIDNEVKFIDVRPIREYAEKINCPYIGIIGGKGTGKTYGCVDIAIQDFYKSDMKHPFFYVRRYDKTFTKSICGNLLNIHRQTIINCSGGKHNTAELMGKVYEVMNKTITSTGIEKRTHKNIIAYCRSMNNVETETGDDKGEISCGIYDEFLSRSGELKDEFLKLQILHSNMLRNRTDRYVPLFMLGNTVSRDSAVAEQFGIKLRDLRRGLNVYRNKKGVPRIVLYYTPETAANSEAATAYYDRFENSHINMISHGDWVLGSYKIASQNQLYKNGFTWKLFNNGVAVNVTMYINGLTPVIVVKKPSENYNIGVSPIIGKNNIITMPKQIIQCVINGAMFAETSEIGEDFRDICKHINGGLQIVNYIG